VRDGTDYLIGLANTGEGSAARDAIFPATLADSVTVWPALLRLARDESRSQSVRKQAIFWVAQAAGERVAGVERDDVSEESEIKKQAVFALSQRRNGEAVPALIQVARVNRDPEVRRTAMFWLGQTTDTRAVDFFAEVLRR
jgi:HEAT repeat protein